MRRSPAIVNHERGFLMVEVLIALAFMAIITFWQMNSAIANFQESIGKISGGQLKTIGDALGAYATANANAVINNSAVTGVATTRSPTVAELVNLGFLSSASGSSNINGGTYVLSLSKNPAACVQPNCNISGYVLLNKPLQINGAFSPAMTGEALKAMGSDGGASTLNGATIQGSNASWSMVNPLAGQPQGTIAYQAGSQSIAMSQLVRRDGTTAMTGSLNLGGNSVFNLTTVAAGSVCSTAGALAQTATGSTLYCDGASSTYKAMGGGGITSKAAVATYAALPLAGNTSGDLRRVTGLGNQPFIWDGATWQGLSVDSSGNTVITGTATIDSLAGNLTVTTTATVGTACSPNGRIAQDGTGLMLSCQSGVWKDAASSRGLSITGATSGWTTFTVSAVLSNTLLASNPTNSQITIASSGSYFITSSQYTCTAGSTYAGTTIYVNGVSQAAGVSYPNSCDSSSASIFKVLAVGDVVTATCGDNGGRASSCYMSVIRL